MGSIPIAGTPSLDDVGIGFPSKWL
jgi:hypothetical protein